MTPEELKATALYYGEGFNWACHPLRRNEDGFAKVRAGDTTVEEVLRVVYE